jgi:hypothetical protein
MEKTQFINALVYVAENGCKERVAERTRELGQCLCKNEPVEQERCSCKTSLSV